MQAHSSSVQSGGHKSLEWTSLSALNEFTMIGEDCDVVAKLSHLLGLDTEGNSSV